MPAVYRSESGRQAVEERYRRFLDLWPVPAEHVRVPTSQGPTFVLVSGPAGAPPLVLLHGSTTNSAMWLPDVAALARHFRVHAVDLIGEPGLSAPTRPPLTSDAHARWLQDVLDALHLTRPAIAAVSLGAWIALDHATRHPANVDRLALLAPAGIGPQRWARPLLAALALPFGTPGRRLALHLLLGTTPTGAGTTPTAAGTTPTAAGAAPTAAGATSTADVAPAAGATSSAAGTGPAAGTASLGAGARTGAESAGEAADSAASVGGAAEDFTAFMLLISRNFRSRRERLPVFDDEALSRLRMPMLVIVGARDAFLDSNATRRRLAHAVPHAQVHYLPDAGHYLPGQTTRILDFLLESFRA